MTKQTNALKAYLERKNKDVIPSIGLDQAVRYVLGKKNGHKHSALNELLVDAVKSGDLLVAEQICMRSDLELTRNDHMTIAEYHLSRTRICSVETAVRDMDFDIFVGWCAELLRTRPIHLSKTALTWLKRQPVILGIGPALS